MSWLIVLITMVLLIVIVRKTIDRETAKNFKTLGKVVGAVLVVIVLWALLSFLGR